MGGFPCIGQIGAGDGGWHGHPATLYCHLAPKSPSLGNGNFPKKFCHFSHMRRGVEVMQWPARSPDPNPIEHIWDQMGQFI